MIVTRINPVKNTLRLGEREELLTRRMVISEVIEAIPGSLEDAGTVDVQIRYRSAAIPASLQKGEVPGGPMQFNFVLGVSGCTPATAGNLDYLVRQLPAGSTWTATGIGRSAFPLAAIAIAMGGNVRVGFEDNIYLGKGQKAASNGELVAKVARIAHELGREIATPEEARKILSLA